MIERFRYLDRRLLLSLALAIVAALLLLGLAIFGPAEARFGAAIGLIGLLVFMQVFVLFYRPPDRSPFGKARAAFVEGDFTEAAAQLEALLEERPSVRGYTLLGNTYRQLGRLEDSQAAIEQALALKPNNAYALYGLGRTELAFGRFDAAADCFDKALAAGAPSTVACDLGFAEYFAGNHAQALKTLQKTTRILRIEPYRVYLTNAILYQLIADKQSASAQLTLQNMRGALDGSEYWTAEVARHSGTPYSAALAELLASVPKDV